MKKITSFLMLFLLMVGTTWAQDLVYSGVKALPEAKVAPADLATGYYMLKEVNPTKNKMGWMKAQSEAVGSSVTPTVGQVDPNNCGNYLWYIEKTVTKDAQNVENVTYSVSTVNKKAAWQEPSLNTKNLVAYNSKAQLKMVTEQVSLGGHTCQAQAGSFMLARADKGSYFHYSGSDLGSWTDVNPASVMMFEAYPVAEQDLLQTEVFPFTLSTLNPDGSWKNVEWYEVKIPSDSRYMQVNGVDFHAKTGKTTDKSHLFAFVKESQGVQVYNFAVKDKVMGITATGSGSQVKMLDKNDAAAKTFWKVGKNGNGFNFKNIEGNNTYINRYQGGSNTALKIWQNGGGANDANGCFVFETPDLNLPVEGKKYYLFNDHQQGKQYFYDNQGQMGWASEAEKKANDRKFVWVCSQNEDGSFVLRNNGTGKYFGWKSISGEPYNWTLSSKTEVVHPERTNISMFGPNVPNVQGGRYLVCTYKNNQWSWNQSTHKENSAEHGSDFHFEECTVADNDFITEPVTQFFAQEYGASFVRMDFFRDGSYAADATAKGASNLKASYADAGQVWSFVGTSDNFKIFNLVKGAEVALSVANAKAETAATFVARNDACSWKLVAKDFGSYAVVPNLPVDDRPCSLNSFRGPGGELKLYRFDDLGGWWKFQLVAEAFTLKNEIVGENPYPENNDRVGDLRLSFKGKTLASTITAADQNTYYLPVDAEVTLDQSYWYRGFAKEGFKVDNEDKLRDIVVFTMGTPQQPANIISRFRVAPETGQYLFKSPDANGKPYRIPAIATAPNGHIMAISDFRPGRADVGRGEVDIKYRFSTDDGESWGAEQTLADGHWGSGEVWQYSFGDAAVVADCERNEILIMMVCGNKSCWDGNYHPDHLNDEAYAPNRVARSYAKFDEATNTWKVSEPEEVSNSIYSKFVKIENGQKVPTVKSMFIGSGRICQSRVTKVGDYYRLYCAMFTTTGGNRVIYSDDFGKTWEVLGGVDARPAVNGDEPKCEELPDGSVVLSSRKRYGRYFNIFRFNEGSTSEGTWGNVVESNSQSVPGGIAFGSNGTNGEILSVQAVNANGEKKTVMLQSVPTGDNRSNVTIFYKEIDPAVKYTSETFAAEWKRGMQVSNRLSAYSTMTIQKNHKIGFFMEEEPGEYSMVYVPLLLEDITGKEYKMDETPAALTVQTQDAANLNCALATFSASYATTPDVAGVKAYIATGIGSGTVKLTELPAIEGQVVVPAKTGVVLQTASAQKFTMVKSNLEPSSLPENRLVGTNDQAMDLNQGPAYILSADAEGNAAFFRVVEEPGLWTVAAHKAFLPYNPNVATEKMNISFGDVTGIEGVEGEVAADGPVYDLSGRRVAKAVKGGVYIQNGKKFIVK